MAKMKAALWWGGVLVAIGLLSLLRPICAQAQDDEVDALVEAEAFEGLGGAMADEMMGEMEAEMAAVVVPQLGAFTAEADATEAESSELIGPTTNPSVDPVLGDGEFVIRKTHLHVPGYGVPFEVRLTYRSRANHQSSIGFGWSHNYARHIEDVMPPGGSDCEGDVIYVNDSMERITFRPVATSYSTGVTSYRATTADVPLRLEKHAYGPSLYEIKDGSGLTYGFNKVGGTYASLTRVSDAAGNALGISWDNSVANDDGGIVTRVIDTSGRNFYYNYVKRLSQRDPTRCAQQLGWLGWLDDSCSPITVAQLMCVSQTQNDCSSPLVSFTQTFPDNNNEFDLTRVLDANGHGPTFAYLSGFPQVTYVADDQLTPACHLICDNRSNAAESWSCHNRDVCTNAINSTINTLCGGITRPFNVPANGYGCWSYCGQACQDPNQTCFADGFDHKVDINDLACGEEDASDPGPSKDFWHALCECDVASYLGLCNSPDPSVQASIAANQSLGGEGAKDFCNDVAANANPSVAHADVCPSFSSACYAKIGDEVRTSNADCSTKCFQDCHEADGATDANGNRRYAFGRPQDLNHDLVDVRDGDGRIVVHNDYGQDPFEIDFDRIVKNHAGDATDATVTYAYHDLRAEQALNGGDFLGFFESLGLSPLEIFGEIFALNGGTPVYPVHPDPGNVVPLSNFDSVDVCNDSCTGPIVQPPLPAVASAGMLQLSTIDPKKSGVVWVGEPIVLAPAERGTYSVVSGPPRTFAAGHVLWASVSKAGNVRLRATKDPDKFNIEGDSAAIAAVFGADSKLQLQQGAGLKYSAIPPVRPPSPGRVPTPVGGKPAMAKTTRPVVKKISGRRPFEAIVPQAPPAPTSLFSTAMARAGFSIGSAPLVLERKGSVATLVSPNAGAELAQASSAKGQISIKATGSARTLVLSGPITAAAGDNGRIAVVSLPGGELAVVSPTAVLGTQRVNIGLDQAMSDGLLTDGMACRRWSQGPVKVAPTGGSAVQQPEHAVVVHDLHGITRTEYYDHAWRLLRDVNRTTGETIDYNYRNGTLHGVRDASGARTCIAADYYGKPLNVTKLPAPGAPGDTQPQVTQYSYTPSGALVDYVRDPGLPTQAAVHRQRDAWDRVLWIDTQIGGATSERTTYSYPSLPIYSAHHIFPTRIVGPDGAATTLAYDPSGAGPTQITTEVPGSSPLQRFIRYDALGRIVQTGRTGHWGSSSGQVYDSAGLVTQEQKADALNAGQWITTNISYNGSRQRLHELDSRIERWLTFDALDHPRTIVEVPKHGTAQKSRCERHSSDGRLDYAIDPEGIVTHDIYDGNNRLVRVDLGHPPNLSVWTNACLAGAPAPGRVRPFPQPSPIGTLESRVSTGRGTPTVAGGQIARLLPPATYRRIAQPITGVGWPPHVPPPPFPPPPQWPAAVPQNDPGMQTVTIRKYAPGGAIVSETDGSGLGKFYVRDGFGRVIDEMNADPATADAATIVHRLRGYDTQDRVIWEAVLSGSNLPAYSKPTGLFPGLESMVERQYDSVGRVTGEDNWRFANGVALGSQLSVHTSHVYDDAHRTLTTTIGNHPSRVTTFDTLGRAVSDRLPNGSIRTTIWREVADGDEQDVTSPSPDGTPLTLTEHFDDRGLGTGTRQGSDQLVSKAYDSFGQLISTVTGQLITTNYSYDDYGRRTGYTIVGAPGPNRNVRFAYDGDDRRSAFTTTNALGDHTTAFIIDGLNRIIETDAPLGRVTTRSYLQGSAQMSNLVDPAGTTVAYTYDAEGRKASEIVTPGSAPGLSNRTTNRSFTYSSFGIKTATVTTVPADAASGSVVTMSYDSSGHRIAENSGALLPLAVERAFDDMGDVTSTILRPASGAPLALSSTRDELGRPANVGIGGRPLAHLTYAGITDPTAIDFGPRASSPGEGPGVTARLSYDKRGRRSGIDVSYGTAGADAVVAKWHDSFGMEGTPRARVRQLAAAPARTDLYEIDTAGPLIKEGDNASLTTALPDRDLVNADVEAALTAAPIRNFLTLDGETNWLSVTTQLQSSTNQIDANDAYSSFGGVPLVTNAAGETLSTGPASAAAANLIFDGLGQLVSATVGSNSISYGYDALGRRVVETVDAPGQPSVATYFVWDGSALRATANSASDASHARVYVSGKKPTELLAIVDGFGAGATHYVHQGPERSVFALSSDSGLTEGYFYDGFGAMHTFDANGQPTSASALGMRLLYQGQLYDPNLAMYAMAAREYSPALGRFLSPDPAGFEGGDNLYAFAAGMPLTRIDPTGLVSQEAIDDSATRAITESELNLGALSEEEEEEAAPKIVPAAAAQTTLEEVPDYTELQAEEDAQLEATTGQMPTPLTPVAEAENSTAFEANSPVSQPLDEALDEELTRGANSQDVWGPGSPTDPEYGSLNRPAYNTLSGHGYWDIQAADEEPWLMPEGKRLLGWGTPGINMTDRLGNSIENGTIPWEPTWSVEPGEPIPPQLKLAPPVNPPLQIGESRISNVITVPSVQSAGDLIVNGPPGDYYWCACQTRMDEYGNLIRRFAVVGLNGIFVPP